MDYQKIDNILKLVEQFLLPLAEQGVQMTKQPEDDLALAFIKGGLPELRKKLEELAAEK